MPSNGDLSDEKVSLPSHWAAPGTVLDLTKGDTAHKPPAGPEDQAAAKEGRRDARKRRQEERLQQLQSGPIESDHVEVSDGRDAPVSSSDSGLAPPAKQAQSSTSSKDQYWGSYLMNDEDAIYVISAAAGTSDISTPTTASTLFKETTELHPKGKVAH